MELLKKSKNTNQPSKLIPLGKLKRVIINRTFAWLTLIALLVINIIIWQWAIQENPEPEFLPVNRQFV
jgi:hypothetical protein